jgi:hypothetical protein
MSPLLGNADADANVSAGARWLTSAREDGRVARLRAGGGTRMASGLRASQDTAADLGDEPASCAQVEPREPLGRTEPT